MLLGGVLIMFGFLLACADRARRAKNYRYKLMMRLTPFDGGSR